MDQILLNDIAKLGVSSLVINIGITSKIHIAQKWVTNRTIENLTEQNNEIFSTNHQGFMHSGQVFVPDRFKITAGKNFKASGKGWPVLHYSLWSKADDLIKVIAHDELERNHLKQYLALSLKNCKNDQEIRDRLPDCLVPLTDYIGLPRDVSFEEANSEKTLKLWNIMRDRIELLSVLPMIQR